MDFQLPEHVSLIQDAISKFCQDNISVTQANQWDKDDAFPREIFDQLAALGLGGLTVEEDYGGSGRDILAGVVAIEELSKHSMALAVPYIMDAFYAGMNLSECGSERQKAELLPLVAAGKMLFAYGWTEPNVGADLASVTTRAVRQGDHFIVNGSKRFCSGADICDIIYTLVQTGAPEDRRNNLSLLLIPPDSKGITIEKIGGLGLKGAATTDVTFEDVIVPVSAVMGEEEGINRGFSMLSGAGLDVEKIEVAAMALGIASAALTEAWNYAEERSQFGQPISAFQTVRHLLADMQTRLYAARLFTYNAAWRANERIRSGVETSMAKLFVTETAKSIVLDAQTVMGAYGYVDGYGIERNVRDILAMPIIGGSSAIQRNNIANWMRLAK
ncbi:acyl-CoA/acyl-ACP dehydrogenase (plasmid) [Sphingobium sp. JS3065]|uniref:acyl-CoA dehydrogenase family protein n=1 Tax=Sphingobium sp. JS3065 TaxID=2970925 RepID=UPI0022654A55|nr:acyl-CoA dehydrogenase family protein [Sphingobium sp. JS3065]UZW58278.1 acyl-CoA/acyl-ACP dehydrogenase [Sphingobium sp. JS3065]